MGRALPSLCVLLAAGCASEGFPSRAHGAPALFRTATVDTPASPFFARPLREPVPDPALPPAAGAKDGVSIEVRFEDSDGGTILAPRITAFHGQRANVQVLQQVSYVADFEVERKDDACITDPVIAVAQDGVVLEMTARPAARGTALAYAVRLARLHRPIDVESYTDLQGNRLTLQLPCFDRAEAEGIRGMEDGVWGLLARLPDGRGGTLSVLARVVPERIEFSSEDEDARDIALIDPAAGPRRGAPFPAGGEDSLPARAARAPLPASLPGRLDLTAMTFPSDLPPGSVVEAGAAAGSFEGAEPVEPGDLQFVTGLVPGARAACLLEETYVKDYRIEAGTGGRGLTRATRSSTSRLL